MLADEQYEGRGRADRGWFSPDSMGLWMSVIHESALPPERLAPLSVAAAVTVAGTLRRETGLEIGVKWPNDLLAGGKKLGGILVESVEARGRQQVVLGMGLNVGLTAEDIPEELAATATSLAIEAKRPVQRLVVLQLLAPALEGCLEDYELECMAGLRDRWRALSTTLGREVTISPGTSGDGSGPLFTGTVVDLAESGALVIRFASGGTREIWFGDVTLRHA